MKNEINFIKDSDYTITAKIFNRVQALRADLACIEGSKIKNSIKIDNTLMGAAEAFARELKELKEQNC